jgi:hypothetical protein
LKENPVKKRLITHDYNQSPFYKLTTKRKLAARLKVELDDLDMLQELSTTYRRAWLHKKDKTWINEPPQLGKEDDYRPIDIPDERLKSAQKILEVHLSRISVPANLYSPVKKRSYVDNAAAHTDADSVYSMDIENYFPSTSKTKVISFFRNVMHCPKDVSLILANIAMKDGGLPQGSPCSPIIAYHANRAMWDEITDAVNASGCYNTIYADDLTISGSKVEQKLIYIVQRIVKKHGMSINPKKNKRAYRDAPVITGVVVKDGVLHLPNVQHLKIRNAARDVSAATSVKDREKAVMKLKSRHSQKRQIESLNLQK